MEAPPLRFSPDRPSSGPTEVAVRAQGLTKKFGEEIAVNDVTFEVPRGTIFGFIGPSGSGKTTTIRLMIGIADPTSGTVTVLGKQPAAFTQAMRERIGYMPQFFVLYPDLTVWENLNFAASIYGMGLRRGKWFNQLLEFVELKDHKHKLARQLSGGMQRRLSLVATLVHNPEVLFLDEPTTGIDPVLRRKLWDHFKELQTRGRTLFVTTQYVGEAAYCDLIGVLAEGRLLMVETPEGLRRRAFGGEIVDLSTAERVDYNHLMQLQSLPFVQDRIRVLSPNNLRLVVDEASTAMPALLEWCKEQNLAVESVEEHQPPFDDVFVEVVKRETANA
ncbi:MAG: ABC transporter ATP-binding protein [Anaerolineales bacterium]